MTDIAPSLLLDKRQRAMLKEIGVRVWSPLPETTAAALQQRAAAAPESAAVQPAGSTAGETLTPEKVTELSVQPAAVPAAARAAAPVDLGTAFAAPTALAAAWQFAAPHALFADAPPGNGGARWLVLAQASEADLQAASFDPLHGEAGTLLGNMLRAARLAEPGRVVLVPLARSAAAEATPAPVSAHTARTESLAALVQAHQPHVLLIMGRLAAQVLLQSNEPLGKLRGQVHPLHGVRCVVTYDAAPLLRTPQDKAKAWDDLCLAMVQADEAFRQG